MYVCLLKAPSCSVLNKYTSGILLKLNGYPFRKDNSVKISYLSSEKESTLKGKASRGSKALPCPLKWTPLNVEGAKPCLLEWTPLNVANSFLLE